MTTASWRTRTVGALALAVSLALAGGTVAQAASPDKDAAKHVYTLMILDIDVLHTGDGPICGEISDFRVAVNGMTRFFPDNGAGWTFADGSLYQSYCHQDYPTGHLKAGVSMFHGSAPVGTHLLLFGHAQELDPLPSAGITGTGAQDIQVPPPGSYTDRMLVVADDTGQKLALGVIVRVITS